MPPGRRAKHGLVAPEATYFARFLLPLPSVRSAPPYPPGNTGGSRVAPSPAGPGPSNLNTDNQVRRRGSQRRENNMCLSQGIWAPPSVGTHRISPLPSEAKRDSKSGAQGFFQSVLKDVFSHDRKVGCYALGPHVPSLADHCFSVMEYSSETLTLAFSWDFMYGYDVTDLMCLKRPTSQKSCQLSESRETPVL